jgi:hypothetical protein
MSAWARMPITSSSRSITGNEPASSFFIICAASASDCDELAVRGFGVMTSRTLLANPSLLPPRVSEVPYPQGVPRNAGLPHTARHR